MNNEDKESIARKLIWEGGLEEYICYGVDDRLYNEFKDEFDKYTKIIDSNKKLPIKKFKEFEIKVIKFLNADDYINEINEPSGMFGCRELIWCKDMNKKNELINERNRWLSQALSK